jgi:outer membrane autotransporter protein
MPVYADQSQSFVWVADTRGDANNDLVTTSILTPIVNSILALSVKPKVVIFGGDAAYRGGYDTGVSNLPGFKAVFTDRLTAVGIPSAFAVGNHELYTMHHAPNLADQALSRQEDVQKYFNGTDLLTIQKQNVPGHPELNNLALSFHIGNSRFIIADSFYATTNGPEPAYGINQAQQDWMKGLLANNTAAHTFVLTHVPAWSPETPSANPNMLNTWQTITTSGNANNTNASILFAGHEHLYYRTQHDGTYQVLAGTGGAPMGCEENPPCNYGPVYPDDVYKLKYNYAVTSINGREITVRVFDEFNSSVDQFYFFDSSGVSNTTINNTTDIAPAAELQQPTGILAASNNIITNSASISNVFTGIDAVHNNTITNSGRITPLPGGNGILVYDNNTITNTTTGSITGNSSDLWGVRVNTGNTIINHGTIDVAGTNSIAFLAQGDNNTLINTGILRASGTDSYAAKFLGTGNNLVNSGTLSGTLWFDVGDNTGTINNTAGGYILGRLYVGGLVVVNNAGTLSIPVSDVGHIAGNYTQQAGGILTLGAETSGIYGRMQIDGIANFTASPIMGIHATPNNTLAVGHTLDNVVSAGTLTGIASGAAVTVVGTPLFTFTGVEDGASHIDVTLTSKKTFRGVLGTALGGTLDGLVGGYTGTGAMDTLLDALYNLNYRSELDSAATNLSPILAEGMNQSTYSVIQDLTRIIQSRQDGNRGMSSGDLFYGDRQFWFKPIGSRADQDDHSGIAGFKAKTYGMVFGADGEVSQTTRIGGAFSYARSSVDSKSEPARQSGDVDSYQLMAYGNYSRDPKTDLSFRAGYGYHKNDGKRCIEVGLLTPSTARSNYTGWSANLGAAIGYAFDISPVVSFTPVIRTDYTYIYSNAYTESGAGALDLAVRSNNTDTLVLGVDGKLAYALSDTARITANMGVGYDVLSDRNSITSSFVGGGAAFSTKGIDPSPWIMRGGLGFVMSRSKSMEVTASYDAEWRSSDFTNQAASINVRMPF